MKCKETYNNYINCTYYKGNILKAKGLKKSKLLKIIEFLWYRGFCLLLIPFNILSECNCSNKKNHRNRSRIYRSICDYRKAIHIVWESKASKTCLPKSLPGK